MSKKDNPDNNFKFTIPAHLIKSDEEGYRIEGVASTETVDQQGEKIIQKGIDLSPVDSGKGFFNFDHSNAPEDLIGAIESYNHDENGLFVRGSLFKGHKRAEAVRAIMKNLKGKNQKAVGFSVEGQVLERDPLNSKIIKKCRIKNVALTFNPVNTDTYASIAKSMTAGSIEFDSTKENNVVEVPVEEKKTAPEATFTASQVVDIVQKALSISDGATKAPETRIGGDALAQSSMKAEDEKCGKDDKDCKKKKKKLTKTDMYKSKIRTAFDALMEKYPEADKEYVWQVLKDKINERF